MIGAQLVDDVGRCLVERGDAPTPRGDLEREQARADHRRLGQGCGDPEAAKHGLDVRLHLLGLLLRVRVLGGRHGADRAHDGGSRLPVWSRAGSQCSRRRPVAVRQVGRVRRSARVAHGTRGAELVAERGRRLQSVLRPARHVPDQRQEALFDERVGLGGGHPGDRQRRIEAQHDGARVELLVLAQKMAIEGDLRAIELIIGVVGELVFDDVELSPSPGVERIDASSEPDGAGGGLERGFDGELAVVNELRQPLGGRRIGGELAGEEARQRPQRLGQIGQSRRASSSAWASRRALARGS